jgi:Amt family ammonium transporter
MAINAADTAFMFLSMCLVQLMTPGLAFFYGGLVRSTTIITIMFQSYVALGAIFFVWCAAAFSLSFGPSIGGIIGNPFSFAFFQNIEIQAPFTIDGEVIVQGIPGLLFAGYQGMFAVITPALMTGCFADRFRMGPYLLFIILWMFLVYAPVCHWLWGKGWMATWGAWDFAGGLVVHVTSGFSALASLIVLGERHVPEGSKANFSQPHNIPFVALGTALLWFGWFGFNGGSALASNGTATVAALNSQIAGSTAMLGWMIMDVLNGKTPGLVGACVGAVAGLATVTPCAGFVQIWAAIVLGIAASLVCYICVELLNKHGFDDALDVWGVHGMGGLTGTILLGVLADDPSCGQPPTDGQSLVGCANPNTVTRSADQFLKQLVCTVIVAAYSFGITFVVLNILERTMGIRPRRREELDLDYSQHGEVAYVTHANPRDGNLAVYDTESEYSPTSRSPRSPISPQRHGATNPGTLLPHGERGEGYKGISMSQFMAQ